MAIIQNISSINKNGPSRTAATLEKYIKRAKGLEVLARKAITSSMPYAIEQGQPISPMQLAAWLIKDMRSGRISSSTYRQYKSALIASFGLLKSSDEVSEAIDLLKQTLHESGVKPVVKRASARKSKTISMDDLVKLSEYMQNREGKYNKLAVLWLTASYHMGLRPCEWKLATIVDGVVFSENEPPEMALRVVNAKNTNGRSHGKFRNLPLMHLDTYSRETVIEFIELLSIEMQGMTFEALYNGCKCAIYNNSRRCFSRRRNGVSMYTMRHQFSANAKNSLSLQEVGALMGHAVADTSKTHYAKARSGIEVPGLKAASNEVARVKKETTNPFVSKIDQMDGQHTAG
ncbi:MAG: hypothetical protein CTY35_00210 [Methylotenera sp.]|uniref:hypothetical protein n=1 Tax=Methylotenera sp. TaxID=2051956 RepID=UPI000D47E8E6|nr:hypothetical protein [Methylotenera sp.]PPD02137.1 MAG: hypothetical protein CTY35_00210 [Methylotenera sp.]